MIVENFRMVIVQASHNDERKTGPCAVQSNFFRKTPPFALQTPQVLNLFKGLSFSAMSTSSSSPAMQAFAPFFHLR
ncbi:MAG: hypothetical protein ABQ298_02635 [Puniceicoccaceae bacterium]